MLATWPSTRRACGVVKTSSVGMFGLQMMPFLAVDGAALPFMAVGQPDGQIGAGAGEMQRVEALAVEPGRCGCASRALCAAQAATGSSGRRARRRRSHRRAWRPRRPRHRPGRPASPRRVRIGDDVPVDVEAGDLLQRRLVGDRVGLVGARHLGRVLGRQQHRVVADDGEPRRVVGEGLGHALIEPAGGAVEARVGGDAEARQRRSPRRTERRHQAGAGLVGVLGDPPHQRQRGDRRGHDQILAGLQVEADLARRPRASRSSLSGSITASLSACWLVMPSDPAAGGRDGLSPDGRFENGRLGEAGAVQRLGFAPGDRVDRGQEEPCWVWWSAACSRPSR